MEGRAPARPMLDGGTTAVSSLYSKGRDNARPSIYCPDLPPHHCPEENNQDPDRDETERRAREEFRRPIETLPTAGSHETDKRHDKPDAVTDQRDDQSCRRIPTDGRSGDCAAKKPEPEEKKRCQSKFAEMIHADDLVNRCRYFPQIRHGAAPSARGHRHRPRSGRSTYRILTSPLPNHLTAMAAAPIPSGFLPPQSVAG